MKALVLALGLVAAACGGGGSSDGVVSLEDGDSALAAGADAAVGDDAPTTTLGEMTDEEALLAFAQCMRDNGYDIPDPTVDADGNVRLQRPTDDDGQPPGEGFDDEARRAAFESCGQYLDGVTQGRRNADVTEFSDELLSFAACVRDNGYDMPDPDLNAIGGGPGNGPFGDIDRSDPAFQAAAEACQDILAGFGRGPGISGPGGGGGDE